MEDSTRTGRRNVLKAVGGGLLIAPFAAPAGASAESTGHRTGSARERRITRLTLDAFEAQAGGGSFYDVLADDVIWTVAAAEPSTHHGKDAFLANGAGPVIDRLATPLVPEVRGVWARNDTVIIQWDGSATARDGLPYRNSYCWIWVYRGDSVSRATAFLDLTAIEDLFERVPLPAS